MKLLMVNTSSALLTGKRKEMMNMAKYYNVSVDANWADEIDFSGHEILTEEEIKDIEFALEHFGHTSISYGSNEEGNLSDIDISYDLDKPLKDEEVKMLRKLNLMKSGFTVTKHAYNLEDVTTIIFKEDKVFAMDNSIHLVKSDEDRKGLAKDLQEEYPEKIKSCLNYEILEVGLSELKELLKTHEEVDMV